MSNKNKNLTNKIIDHLKMKNIHSNTKRKTLWKIDYSKLGGRGLFAIQDIEVHELIFRDSPLLLGPRRDLPTFTPICVTCYKKIKNCQSDLECCPNGCTLPICENCSGNEKHKKECDIIRSWIPKNPNKLSFNIFRALTSIRGIILNENETALLKLLQKNFSYTQENEIEAIRDEFENFPEDLNFLNYVSNVLYTNSYEVAINSDGEENVSLRGMYSLASLMNHSCIPNTRICFDKKKIMTVRATKKIKKGEEICTSYTQLIWGSPYRRAFLSNSKNFLCNCVRCADPTEFGTYMLAVPCTDKNCEGKIIPKNSLSFKSQWICNICSITTDSNSISSIQKINSAVVRDQMSDENIQNIINYCRLDLPTFLPPFNQFSVELKLFLIWKIDGNYNDFKLEDYLDKEQYCLDLLNLIQTLNLGECVKAGVLYFELYKCQQEIQKIQLLTPACNKLLLQKSWMILGENISCPTELLDLKKNNLIF